MRTLAGWLLAVLPAAAFAHHSQALYDLDRTVTLDGTVREFQWTNPHCWIRLRVPGRAGAVEWSVEMGNPRQLYAAGWRPGTLSSGDRISLVINPLRNGQKGGQFFSAIAADGRTWGP